MNAADKRRICDLAGLLFEDSIGDNEFQELESLLAHDSASQEWYLHCMQQNVLLDEQLVRSEPTTVRQTPVHFQAYVLAAAASVAFLVGAALVAFSITKANTAIASQPTVEYLPDSVRLSYDDGTVALVEQPARFRLDGNKRLFLDAGKVVARRGTDNSEFEITMASHTFRPRIGEFGLSVADGDPELHVFDGIGDFESDARTSAQKVTTKKVTPGGVYRIDSSGKISPSLISEMAEFSSRLARSNGGIVESFAEDGEQPLSGWKGAWYAPKNGQTVWTIAASDPLTRTSGASLSISRNRETVDGTHEIPWRGERRELEASHIRISRQYGKTDSFSPSKPHAIEFLFRLDSDPQDILRFAMFDGPADVKLEPRPGERTWHIHAGVPPESSYEDDLVWFLRDTTREDEFQFMKLERGVTYRVFIEVAPKRRTFRCTISDGVNVIYNNNKKGLPTYKANSRQAMDGIHLFAWGKPGKECRFSVDEFLIRNTPKPKVIGQ